MENASEETHLNKNSRRRVLDLLSICPAIHLKILITEMWQNISGENLIIKFENSFHIWINVGYICERTLSAMSRVTSVRVLQTAIYNFNFIVLLLISSRISQNWFPTASSVLLLVSRIIYFYKCNRLDIIIFRL